MANILSKTLDTSPTSDDIAYVVNDPAGTPADKRASLGNIITKAHGLSDSTAVGVASGVLTSGTDVAVVDGGTGSSTASGARTNLGLAIGTDVQGHDAQLDDVAGFSPTKGIVLTSTATNLSTLAAGTDGQILTADAASTNGIKWSTPSGAGDTSTNTATSVDSEAVIFSGTSGKLLKRSALTGIIKQTSGVQSVASAGSDYYNPGGTDVAVADGGTGSSTASGARTNLGLAIGTDVVAPNQDTTGKSAKTDALNSATTVVNVSAATAPSTGQVLTATDSTHATWQAAASGGQTLVTKIVAPSGGDYTTLGAALAAASNGWTIFIQPGSYTESAVTDAHNNLNIIGAGMSAVTLTYSTNTAEFDGTKVKIQGVGFSFTTGGLSIQGANSGATDCSITASGNATCLTLGGNFSYFKAGEIYDTNAGSVTVQKVALNTGTNQRFENNYCECVVKSSGQWLNLSGNYSSAKDNQFRATSSSANANLVQMGGTPCTFEGNTTQDNSNNMIVVTIQAGEGHVVSNTSKGFLQFVEVDVGEFVVSGNDAVTTLAGGKGIIVTASSGIIAGNKLKAGGSPTQKGIDLQAGGSDVAVTGNRITSFSTGINIASTNPNCTIVGNNVTGNTTAIVDAGVASTIQDNDGASSLMNKKFLKMKNTSGSTINAGNIVTIKAVAAGDEVTTTTTASDNLVYGMAAASIVNNAIGYIQTLGKTTLLTADGTTDIAIGDFLTTFTSAGIVRKATAGTLGTTPGDLALAIALEAYTTNDSNGVLDALIINPVRL